MTQQILAQLPGLFQAAGVPQLQLGASPGDVFEVYVLGLILEAARREKALVSYENVDGPFQGVCTFRTSPMAIWTDTKSYTHATLQFPMKALLEVHLGIFLEGSSGVCHEADVVVLPRSEGITCRAAKAHPNASRAILTGECKFYTDPLGLALGRGFLGLSAEFGKKKAFFIMNQIPGVIGRLLNPHSCLWEHTIVPASTNDVNRFIGRAQEIFKSYKVAK
jgi:hypothetical protein